jgi:hypothetical protein
LQSTISFNQFQFNLIHDTESYNLQFDFSYDLTDTDEISGIIKSLKSSNAKDIYGVSSTILKKHRLSLSLQL